MGVPSRFRHGGAIQRDTRIIARAAVRVYFYGLQNEWSIGAGRYDPATWPKYIARRYIRYITCQLRSTHKERIEVSPGISRANVRPEVSKKAVRTSDPRPATFMPLNAHHAVYLSDLSRLGSQTTRPFHISSQAWRRAKASQALY